MSDPIPEPQFVAYHATAPAGLITLATAKEHLRVTDNNHDGEIVRTVAYAADVIFDYLKHGVDPAWVDETTTPLPVQAAILKMLTHLYEDRGDRATDTDADAAETLWASIDLLLARFRVPAIA
jgi:hypothetical protein